jgi:penicillin-binding protein 1A
MSGRRLRLTLLAGAAVMVLVVFLAGLLQYRALVRDLPATDTLRELQLGQPLRVYTSDGQLIGEFGAERRAPLAYADLPEPVIQAFLAAEDDRFFEHPGVDWRGLLRAAVNLLATGEKTQGGSTITMQLARNVFLTSERTYTRKAREILLALQIERDLSKEEILELYLNKIFLGSRAYGVGAAAQVYFGRDVHNLTLAQTAVLAGLPKAPSRDNPLVNPERARERRDYVLRRLHQLGRISELDYQAALAEPVIAHTERPWADVEAYYVAEMVRAELYAEHGEDLYTRGLTVITTVEAAAQRGANAAVRQALHDYDERRGWRGPESRLPEAALEQVGADGDAPGTLIDDALDALPAVSGLRPAVVEEFTPQRLRLLTRERQLIELKPEAFAWARLEKDALKRGDIVRVSQAGADWRLAQIPDAQAAFVALDPRDGAVRALVGGYDFFLGKFNRVLQARRQPGSGFKPFLYSAALAYGFTPASIILDAPVVFDDAALEDTWRPENYTGKFYGPTRLRVALVHSRNLVSIRLLQSIGINFARNHMAQFGLPLDRMPRDLTLALGSASFTPLEMARAYAVFANGGFLVEPYYIREIRDASGEVLFRAAPVVACPECAEARVAGAATESLSPEEEPPLAPRVLDPRNVYLIRDILRDAVTVGTGARLREMGRGDLSGKTGTTNEEADAWFAGFSSHLVGVAWVGFDQPQPLGRGEVGGRAALPIWMDFMRTALREVPEDWPERPPGLVSVRINPDNGHMAAAGSPNAVFEIVQAEHLPPPDTETRPDGEAEKATVEDLY